MIFQHPKNTLINGRGLSSSYWTKPSGRAISRHAARGFSLVELMIALVLGLLLIGAVVGELISNRQVFRTTENMARVQENARFAFEALAREVREAGGIPCGTTKVANVLNNSQNYWWGDWDSGPLIGYDDYDGNNDNPSVDGPATNNRVAGTDGILILTANLLEGLVITDHNPTSAQFKVNMANHGIQDGDIVMACDNVSAAIFQVTNANQNNMTIVHNTGTGSPGNCSKGLGWPTVCTTNGTQKTFAKGGIISKFSASYWYIGNNSRDGRSLYRLGLTGSPHPVSQEMVDGVTDMQIEYLARTSTALADSYENASDISNWDKVVAVRIALTLETADAVGIDGDSISRTFTHVISLRNREYAP